MIDAVINVDTRELQKAITEAAKNSSKTLAEIVNKKLSFIVSKAIKLTRKADPNEIKDVFVDGAIAGMIINTIRARKGLRGLYAGDMAVAIQKEVKRRLNAVNFIRSQWKWALLDIIRTTGGSMSNAKMTQRMGGARPAPKTGLFQGVTASGWNDVKGGEAESSRVTDIKVEGLQDAVDAETESTWQHIVDKEFQKRVCDPFNKK